MLKAIEAAISHLKLSRGPRLQQLAAGRAAVHEVAVVASSLFAVHGQHELSALGEVAVRRHVAAGDEDVEGAV